MVLGDLGADVIKIEDSGGDVARGWGPPFIADESSHFISINRNKRSVCVDVNKEGGRNVLCELVKKCDVLVESNTPGYMKSLGLGYEDVAHLNPSLIYCSISGYGTSGPLHNIPQDGTVVAAASGFMSITGPENGPNDGPACVVGVPITEIITAVHACGAINAALLERTKTQKGRHIQTSLLRTQVSYLSHIMASYLNAGVVGRKYGTAHASIVPYQAFKTQDKHIIVAAGSDDQFRKTCRVLGCGELAHDERFSTNAQRVVHREILLDTMQRILSERTSKHWLRELEDAGVPCAPVNSVGDVFAMPQVDALDLVQEVEHPDLGDPLKVVGSAMDLDRVSVFRDVLHPPRLGDHSCEVLQEVLGYSEEHCARLMAEGIIKDHVV